MKTIQSGHGLTATIGKTAASSKPLNVAAAPTCGRRRPATK
ncbi:MAG: hypothetical protein O3A00_21545 [Planctomycetota bacterium]|nr:hypothetical protein [Planctomycetota bacterium]